MGFTHLGAQDAHDTAGSGDLTVAYPSTTLAHSLLSASVFVSSSAQLTGVAIVGWPAAAKVEAHEFSPGQWSTVATFANPAGTPVTNVHVVASGSGITLTEMAIHEFASPTQPAVAGVQVNTAISIGVISSAPGPVTPVIQGELVLATFALPSNTSSAWHIDSGFTLMAQTPLLVDAFFIAPTITALDPTLGWTGSSSAISVLAAVADHLPSPINVRWRFGRPQRRWHFGRPRKAHR